MIFEYIHFAVSVLVLILVGFIGFAVKNLKGVTRTLKDAFESMKTSVEYVRGVQEISKSLYDPREIEKLVKLRVEAATLEIRAEAEKSLALAKEARDASKEIVQFLQNLEKDLRNQTDQLKNGIMNDIAPLGMFVFSATTFLSPDYLDHTIKLASKQGSSELLMGIVHLAQQAFAEKGYKLPVKIEGFR